MQKGKPALSPAEKSAKSPASAKLAIAAYCYHACHSEQAQNSHTTKRAIRNCADTRCPLWFHRGFQHVTSGKPKTQRTTNN